MTVNFSHNQEILEQLQGELERVEGERDRWRREGVALREEVRHYSDRVLALQELREGVRGEVEREYRVNAHDGIFGPFVDVQSALYELGEHQRGWEEDGGPRPPELESRAVGPWEEGRFGRSTQPKDEGPCETCGGSGITTTMEPPWPVPRGVEPPYFIPCPDCTTGKQGEAGEELTMIALALKNAGIEGCRPERGVEIVIDRLYSTQHPDIQGLVKELEDLAATERKKITPSLPEPAKHCYRDRAGAFDDAAQLVRELLSDSGVER